MPSTHQGGCLCGAIRYTVDAPITGLRACHCINCQKHTGSGGSVNAVVPSDKFQDHQGDNAQVRRLRHAQRPHPEPPLLREVRLADLQPPQPEPRLPRGARWHPRRQERPQDRGQHLDLHRRRVVAHRPVDRVPSREYAAPAIQALGAAAAKIGGAQTPVTSASQN